ncbi:DUF4411 family protein [Xanthomonas graminis]|uniref:DUF4411 family protein n=1 Tax=Xanthomonas graminis pv. poae TaxID=227946 RepID=A0A199NWQ3_9XANT|nr:DUF4411 family protein [Xanthomonas translucens]OAX53434.1 hypothetical protein A6R73_00790 [Xanthomonas translucens pv. poae]
MAPVYSIDSSSLIHAWNRAYRPKNFPTFWVHLENLILDGRLKASMEVLEELKKKDDEVYTWAKGRKDLLFVEIDDPVQDAVVYLMANHERLVDTVKGKSGGDPFVIGLALASDPQMIVVTEEDAGKVRIPDVCRAVGLDCMRLADFIEREDWKM